MWTFKNLVFALFLHRNFEAATRHLQTTAGILFIAENRSSPGSSSQDLNFIESFDVYPQKYLVMQTASSGFIHSLIFSILNREFRKRTKNLQQNLECAALRLIRRGHFNYRPCKLWQCCFFRNAHERFSCERECATKEHKYEFFFMETTNNVTGNYHCFFSKVEAAQDWPGCWWRMGVKVKSEGNKKERKKEKMSCRNTAGVQN